MTRFAVLLVAALVAAWLAVLLPPLATSSTANLVIRRTA